MYKCRFTEKLTIIVLKGKRFTVDLTADGLGTTIVCNPPVKGGVDLGTHFACQTCQKRFTFTNRGRRTQVGQPGTGMYMCIEQLQTSPSPLTLYIVSLMDR